jgi:hypothetical protein
MSGTDTQENGRARSLSDEQKDALIGELLGDVQKLHKSMKDLVAIVRDSDERISGRIVELRQVAGDFANSRDAALAHLATQASETAQHRFTDSMGDMLKRVDVSLVAIERLVPDRPARRLFDLAAVALMTGGITAAAALFGVWMIGP